MRHHLNAGLFPLVLSACSAGAGELEIVVRDSAGVTIVEHTDRPATTSWSLSTDPILRLGVRDGVESQMLFRVVAAFRLSDGRIVVANGGSTEFRFYDSTGTHVASAGGPGGGPGEMRVLFEVTRLPGDTLVGFDPALGRLDWFAPTGSFVRRTQVDLRSLVSPPYFAEGGHVLPDRTILMRVYEGTGGRAFPEGVSRSNLGFFRYDPSISRVDTLTWVKALENFLIRVGERPVPGVRPFARMTLEAWGADAVYIMDTERYELQVFDLVDGQTTLVRRDVMGPAVTAADRSMFEERYRGFMDRNPSRQGDMERWLAAVTYPETKPPIMGLHVDRLGRAWVGETPAQEGSPVPWSVFDQTHRLTARVLLPSGFDPMDIGRDYVLGHVRDADDVEFIEMYRLIQ